VLYLRQMGVTEPIVSSHGLDTDDLWKVAGTASANVFVASGSDPETPDPVFQSFRQRYRARYGTEPDYGAAQGYQSMMLLIQAIAITRSADPLAVATTLHTVPKWRGLYGDFSFTRQGDMNGVDVVVKEVRRGAFRVVFRERVTEEARASHRVIARAMERSPVTGLPRATRR
jgi:branched-chain amino acid transport system substrate-binding protein